ncbi:MAG: TIM barrel protein [Clostridia bacterium]|nr:TIM barrel protein [Clostridia bacterium]
MEKAIDILASSGYDAIDFSQFDKFVYEADFGKDYYTEIRKLAESKGVYFNQSHAPFGSSFKDEEKTKKRFDEIVTAIKRASYLGVQNIIVHPCQHLEYDVEGNPEKLLSIIWIFIKSLSLIAKNMKLRLLLKICGNEQGILTIQPAQSLMSL